MLGLSMLLSVSTVCQVIPRARARFKAGSSARVTTSRELHPPRCSATRRRSSTVKLATFRPPRWSSQMMIAGLSTRWRSSISQSRKVLCTRCSAKGEEQTHGVKDAANAREVEREARPYRPLTFHHVSTQAWAAWAKEEPALLA